MIPELLATHWNDILTVGTFTFTSLLAFYQIRYYRDQRPSFELVSVTDAEYTDFDEYTKYEFTIQIRNGGRDPITIPNARLTVNDEEIQLNNVKQFEQISPRIQGGGLPDHEFRTIQLGANALEHIELFGTGDPVVTNDEITGELSMTTSVGEIREVITFDRAP